jgi:hypothetical protein
MGVQAAHASTATVLLTVPPFDQWFRATKKGKHRNPLKLRFCGLRRLLSDFNVTDLKKPAEHFVNSEDEGLRREKLLPELYISTHWSGSEWATC